MLTCSMNLYYKAIILTCYAYTYSTASSVQSSTTIKWTSKKTLEKQVLKKKREKIQTIVFLCFIVSCITFTMYKIYKYYNPTYDPMDPSNFKTPTKRSTSTF